jgi:hypothetical protein
VPGFSLGSDSPLQGAIDIMGCGAEGGETYARDNHRQKDRSGSHGGILREEILFMENIEGGTPSLPGGRVLPIWIARGVRETCLEKFSEDWSRCGGSSWDILARNWPVKEPGAEAEQQRTDGQTATKVT